MVAAKEQFLEIMHHIRQVTILGWTLLYLQEGEIAKGSTLMSTTCTHSCQGGSTTAVDLDEVLEFMLRAPEQPGCAQRS
jgi:hypothetical protein